MALDDEDRRKADCHTLICMQAAFRKVVCSKHGVQVQRRNSRKIDEATLLSEANRSEGMTTIPSVWSNE